MGAVLADLGLSSFQLDDPRRGFSFQEDGPLDMRFDPSATGPTAADLVRDLAERDLADLLFRLGDEPHARRIARAVAEARREGPIVTTRQLAELVERARPAGRRGRPPHGRRTHPATRVFQALRIAVNAEQEGLSGFVRDAVEVLAPAGRLAVISFHGGEDGILKNALRDLAGRCTCPPEAPRCTCGRTPFVRLLTKRPTWAGAAEIAMNPRARSARLRCAEKLAPSSSSSFATAAPAASPRRRT